MGVLPLHPRAFYLSLSLYLSPCISLLLTHSCSSSALSLPVSLSLPLQPYNYDSPRPLPLSLYICIKGVRLMIKRHRYLPTPHLSPHVSRSIIFPFSFLFPLLSPYVSLSIIFPFSFPPPPFPISVHMYTGCEMDEEEALVSPHPTSLSLCLSFNYLSLQLPFPPPPISVHMFICSKIDEEVQVFRPIHLVQQVLNSVYGRAQVCRQGMNGWMGEQIDR